MVRSTEERFAVERMATPGFGAKKIATTLGLPQPTMKRWLQRLHSDGDKASRNIGRARGGEAGLCVIVFLHVSTHISRRVMCATCLWVHGCNEERVRAAALTNACIFVEPCCTVAGKRLQASGIERGRSSGQEYMKAEHWPAMQVIRG